MPYENIEKSNYRWQKQLLEHCYCESLLVKRHPFELTRKNLMLKNFILYEYALRKSYLHRKNNLRIYLLIFPSDGEMDPFYLNW